MEDIYLLRGGGLNTSTPLNLFTREGTHLKDVESNKPRYTIRFEGLEASKKKVAVFWKEKNREKKERKNRIVATGYLNPGTDEIVDIWVYHYTNEDTPNIRPKLINEINSLKQVLDQLRPRASTVYNSNNQMLLAKTLMVLSSMA